jgi:hypothetical protein
MPDPFASHADGLGSPASNAAAVTPNDGADLANFSRSLFIGGAGNVTVDLVGGGTNVQFASVAAGTILPIRAKRVYATGTTATAIVALW